MSDLDTLSEPPGAAASLSKRGSRRWVALVLVVLVLGVAVSILGAALLRSSAHTHERQTFNETAADVTATLDSLLRRDADFVTTLRAVLSIEPHQGTHAFEGWLTRLQGPRRLTGGRGALVLERVPARALDSFLSRRRRDGAFRALIGGVPAPVHLAGGGPYCLLSSGSVHPGLPRGLTRVLQGNWCSPSSPLGISQGPLLSRQVDAGGILVEPATGQGVNTIVFATAIYRPEAGLASVAQRRAAVLGWVLTSFDIPTIMRESIGAHRELSMALYRTNPGQQATLVHHLGPGSRRDELTHSTNLQIEGEWTVRVSGPAPAGAIPAELQGLLVLAFGLLITTLLCALIVVLSRTREHALGLVRQKTGQLRHQALHDSLTGLPNRVLALDRAEQMLARARRLKIPLAALYVDIDGFKGVNDSFGHAAGDGLLRIVAERLREVLRDGDTAARLGGDEFVVLLDGATLDDGATLVAERLLEVLRRPYELSDSPRRKLSFTASIGIAFGPRESADELLRDADLALYAAKAGGRDRYALFEPAMQASSRDRLTLEMDLAQALEEEQLFLQYQPIFDLRSQSVTGVEALMRWKHPTRGVISPGEFITIAERSGLIVPIGRWALGEACRQASVWHEQGHAIAVAVNASARQLDEDALIDDVTRALEQSDLDPAALTIEVTETALMRDPEATAGRLAMLKELGVRIAIDDFGTGYSSLAYLRRFPVDVLKIDRSFVEGLATASSSLALVHTLVELGKLLGAQTLAEGIENYEQLTCLQHEGCDQGQGFLFSRPLDAQAIEPLLAGLRTMPYALSA